MHYMSRRCCRLALLITLVAAGIVAVPAAAFAGGLTAADPPDGAALSAAPDAVTLRFTATPDSSLSHVSTRDAAGTEVGAGSLVASGAYALRLPVSIRAAGNYTVAYHVVLADGTELVGVLGFSVGTGVPPPAQPQQAPPSGHDHGVDPISASLLVVDAAVLFGVLLLLSRRAAPNRLAAIDDHSGFAGPDPDRLDA